MTGAMPFDADEPVVLRAYLSETADLKGRGLEMSIAECLDVVICTSGNNAIPMLCRELIRRGWPAADTLIEFVRRRDDEVPPRGKVTRCFGARPLEDWAWLRLTEEDEGFRWRRLTQKQWDEAMRESAPTPASCRKPSPPKGVPAQQSYSKQEREEHP